MQVSITVHVTHLLPLQTLMDLPQSGLLLVFAIPAAAIAARMRSLDRATIGTLRGLVVPQDPYPSAISV